MKHWLIAGMIAAFTVDAAAQQQIEWKQTLNIPRGQNISRDRADILGIEFGDTYAEAKKKLEALYAEHPQPPRRSPTGFDLPRGVDSAVPPPPAVTETTRIFRFEQPGASTLWMASYIAKLEIQRVLPGSRERKIEERITVYLSAPSSGHQVVGIDRMIIYPEADQPRVADVITQVKAKFKAEPKPFSGRFSFQFDNGQPVEPGKRPAADYCSPALTEGDTLDSVKAINETGTCDVALDVSVNYGISREHASSVGFRFGDNERVKANRIADYTYLQAFIDGMRENTRGKVPKL